MSAALAPSNRQPTGRLDLHQRLQARENFQIDVSGKLRCELPRYLSDIHLAPAAAALGRRDHRLDHCPFGIRQIARIAKAMVIGSTTVFRLPHATRHVCDSGATQGITNDSFDSTTYGDVSVSSDHPRVLRQASYADCVCNQAGGLTPFVRPSFGNGVESGTLKEAKKLIPQPKIPCQKYHQAPRHQYGFLPWSYA